MSRTDIKNNVAVAESIRADQHTATVTGENVDLAGFDAAAVVFQVGTVANNDFTFEVQEADDDGTGSPDTYSAVASDDLDGTAPDAPSANTVTTVGYHGIKRWLRVVATSGGTGDVNMCVSVLEAKPRTLPV
ncbi:hypothetical protein [Salininema proteolyticum]|uniref:Uncharacterized protein n=1 Tax=Salininema proteolyticum TaxID=1607685 RepID=A0ABV8TT18_9ACTN